MKIDDAGRNLDIHAAHRTQASKADAAGGRTPGARDTAGDAVAVSDEARLRSEALAAAERAPDIRPEAVARGRALLESGRLGTDHAALADRLIEAALPPERVSD